MTYISYEEGVHTALFLYCAYYEGRKGKDYDSMNLRRLSEPSVFYGALANLELKAFKINERCVVN